MRLVTYCRDRESPRVGVIVKGGIIDLQESSPQLPQDMLGLIRGGQHLLEKIREALPPVEPIPLDAVRLLAPLPHPPEYLGVGLNYRDHLEEAGLSLPTIPTIFNKQTSCITGPYDEVVVPRISQQLDYEGELGIVIGFGSGRHLLREQAAAAIFGYVVVNDLSVRDWQRLSPTHTLGKSFDTHGPFGPWIVTADEVPNPENLLIRTTVNGQVRQRCSTAEMIFGCSEIVAFLSQVMTLQPGTVITTGTPAGVGLFHRPPVYLKVGDLVAVEISSLGQIANRVIAEGQG